MRAGPALVALHLILASFPLAAASGPMGAWGWIHASSAEVNGTIEGPLLAWERRTPPGQDLLQGRIDVEAASLAITVFQRNSTRIGAAPPQHEPVTSQRFESPLLRLNSTMVRAGSVLYLVPDGAAWASAASHCLRLSAPARNESRPPDPFSATPSPPALDVSSSLQASACAPQMRGTITGNVTLEAWDWDFVDSLGRRWTSGESTTQVAPGVEEVEARLLRIEAQQAKLTFNVEERELERLQLQTASAQAAEARVENVEASLSDGEGQRPVVARRLVLTGTIGLSMVTVRGARIEAAVEGTGLHAWADGQRLGWFESMRASGPVSRLDLGRWIWPLLLIGSVIGVAAAFWLRRRRRRQLRRIESLIELGEFATAEEEARRFEQRLVGRVAAQLARAEALVGLGRAEEAARLLETLGRIGRDAQARADLVRALAAAHRQDVERVATYLERAARASPAMRERAKRMPIFLPLRTDPRVAAVLGEKTIVEGYG